MDEDTPHLSENEEEAFEEEEEGEGNEEGEGEYVQVITEDGRTLNISLHLFRLITAGFRRANLQEDDDTDEEDHSQPSYDPMDGLHTRNSALQTKKLTFCAAIIFL